jgi:hypothetical protein
LLHLSTIITPFIASTTILVREVGTQAVAQMGPKNGESMIHAMAMKIMVLFQATLLILLVLPVVYCMEGRHTL